jgi:hypothetical protein
MGSRKLILVLNKLFEIANTTYTYKTTEVSNMRSLTNTYTPKYALKIM